MLVIVAHLLATYSGCEIIQHLSTEGGGLHENAEHGNKGISTHGEASERDFTAQLTTYVGSGQ